MTLVTMVQRTHVEVTTRSTIARTNDTININSGRHILLLVLYQYEYYYRYEY